MVEKVLSILYLNKLRGKVTLKHVSWVIIAFKVLVLLYFVNLLYIGFQQHAFKFGLTFIGFIVAGFVAQLVDGALGMAYGISCTSLLLWFGIPPKFASASVHTS